MSKLPDFILALIINTMIALILLNSFDSEILTISFTCGFISSFILLNSLVKWFRGKIDLFDPSFALAGLNVFILFISPVSQVYWDFWPFLPSMIDDQEWIDVWAVLNLIGVLIYVYTKDKPLTANGTKITKSIVIDNKKFVPTILIFLSLSFLSQVYIYISFGGISGFINAFTQRQEDGLSAGDPFSGLGLIMLVAESFKILIAIFLIYYIKITNRPHSEKSFILLMVILMVIFIFFGGLRGSRSSTLFPLIFAAGMYHFWIAPLNRRLVFIGLAGVLLFSTSYYWYKIAGTNGFSAIFDSSLRGDFHSDRQDANKYLIVRDLGRMDFQSLALKRIYEDDFPLSFGRTYLVSIFSSIPKQIIPYKPDQITKEKTELIHGEGAYDPDGNRQTTLVLGQFGEMLVNFGVFGALLFYFLLGRWVFWVNKMMRELSENDIRRFYLPILSFVPLLMIITDMNVIMYQLTRYLSLPTLMFVFCSKVIKQGEVT